VDELIDAYRIIENVKNIESNWRPRCRQWPHRWQWPTGNVLFIIITVPSIYL